jgi:hypothetical protein
MRTFELLFTLTYIKMDCALACITMPPVRILCITVHYRDATVTYRALSSALWCITVHYSALPCIAVHSRVVAAHNCGITLHVSE